MLSNPFIKVKMAEFVLFIIFLIIFAFIFAFKMLNGESSGKAREDAGALATKGLVSLLWAAGSTLLIYTVFFFIADFFR
jgi:hypothetical protein